MNSLLAQQPEPPYAGSIQPAESNPGDLSAEAASDGSAALLTEIGTLAMVGMVVVGIVLIRRWLNLRARQPLPGLPREQVLPFSRHGMLHDPKYLGRILQNDDPPEGS